ncbi:RNA polymerase sigma factor [Desulfococcaceae bacterium HSG9]|nr:RNA polymerase sigma factor [Desulfococcaceae bacterium HSG9]
MKAKKHAEHLLIERLKQGDEDAFVSLMRQYRAALINIAYGITSDSEESQDIVQEVFLKVYSSIHSFNEKSSIRTWLYRITVNQSLNWIRTWKRRLKWQHQSLTQETSGDGINQPELGSEKYSPSDLFEEKELTWRFEKELKALPKKTRAVFVLRENQGLSYDEIARVLNIKRGTVCSRLYHARLKLKKALLKGDR